jgi:hypothetical protein
MRMVKFSKEFLKSKNLLSIFDGKLEKVPSNEINIDL